MNGRSAGCGSSEDHDETRPSLGLGKCHDLDLDLDVDSKHNDEAAAEAKINTDVDTNASSRPTKRHPSTRQSPTRSRRPTGSHWRMGNGTHIDKQSLATPSPASSPSATTRSTSVDGRLGDMARRGHDRNGMPSEKVPSDRESPLPGRRTRFRSPCSISILSLLATIVGIALLCTIVNSSWSRQIDVKGCRMSYMRPSYLRLREFDTEHTHFATKYSLYLYREQGIDDEKRLRGVPVLFIPGNAGSYKQVRPIAAEAASYFHDALHNGRNADAAQARNLDFFTVDFNEDITAFHGQTLLDQAEYLNEAIRYILSLYLDPRMAARDAGLPDPTSVLILGHSMGGIVARTMLTMPNYQSNSINTIITMSAPHARAPVTFDGQIVSIYEDINKYWRRAYTQKWANNNPLWHVTLVSIAGGGMDTVVPSDYANIESLVPDTHGFTVFTTGVPTVWTGMDHQAILWCDQFRKVLARTMYDVVDVRRSSQTKPRAERMRIFRKRLLTGMEAGTDKTLLSSDATTLLTVEDESRAIMAPGERLVLRQLGHESKPRAHMLPIPPQGSPEAKRFTLLTDIPLDTAGDHGKLEVLFCSVSSLHSTQALDQVQVDIDLSGGAKSPTKFTCKNAAADAISLPASTKHAQHPFMLKADRSSHPFSYLQYDIEEIADHQFVAVIDKAVKRTKGFLVAEFTDASRSRNTSDTNLQQLLGSGLVLDLPAGRPMVMEVNLPNLDSSLIAYDLEIKSQPCKQAGELFAPLLRQHLSRPYESKYFVNAQRVGLSIHGVAPFVPPPLRHKAASERGLSLQFWTDPTCESSLQIDLKVDVVGSLGKLVIRYRTVFAAFPLLVMALVLRKQFRIYDSTGSFISFSESLDSCVRQSLPLVLLSLTLLSLSLKGSGSSMIGFLWNPGTTSGGTSNFHSNDLLTGTRDPSFWFLVPLIGLVCIGVCAVLHHVTVALTMLLSVLYGWTVARPVWRRQDGRRRAQSPAFVPSSPKRRMVTTAVLLFLVSTFIPYQFAYLVACLVQLFTTVRAFRIMSEIGSPASHDFYNYAHSILLLMLWVLPINLPILAVWIRNLAVHWLTPFSSHHNVLSIMPFIILVENLTAGKMVPRIAGSLRHLTSVLLFGTAVCAAVYGVSYAYMLHYLVNMVAAWLVVIHSTSDGWSLTGISSLFDNKPEQDVKRGKTP